ncbi:S-layer homology domain-containing protein [Paenibacillus sp. IB182496]|uniref:S-layer homology domain-containing protein n=1 Tax=Paenibacillus sabuli TaxID=2772509 RepID=A0A927BX68_9BACL|nr:S-layer homology domain-containing protein [Paenibacillus sabuli]MBD2848531.1 S-layer homology domain-containing protein [Paenibacillus sabuli]
MNWKFGSLMLVVAVMLVFTAAGTSAAASGFKDVKSDHWAKGAIDFAAKRDYVGGYPDGSFRPNGTITRAEFVVVLARIAELPAAKSGLFTDIAGHWAEGAIKSAVAAGFVTKADFGTRFKPSQAVTRLEMARMIARALAEGEDYQAYLKAFSGLYNGDLPFVDYRDIMKADLPLIALSYGASIMNGYPDASFGLEKTATRAEAVVMLKSFHDKREKAPEDFQYLRELKEVAETGMNAQAVSNLEPQVNLKTDDITLETRNYTVTLKRLYVLPFEGDTVSMYERKYFWDRNLIAPRLLANKQGYLIGVVNMTAKVTAGRDEITRTFHLNPSAALFYEEPTEKFGLIHHDMKGQYFSEKGRTDEITIYGYYNLDYFYTMFQADSNLDSHILLFNPDKPRVEYNVQ